MGEKERGREGEGERRRGGEKESKRGEGERRRLEEKEGRRGEWERRRVGETARDGLGEKGRRKEEDEVEVGRYSVGPILEAFSTYTITGSFLKKYIQILKKILLFIRCMSKVYFIILKMTEEQFSENESNS